PMEGCLMLRRTTPVRGLVLWTTLTIGEGEHQVDVEMHYTYYPAQVRRAGCPPEPEEVIPDGIEATKLGDVEREGHEDWFADLDWIVAAYVARALCDDGMHAEIFQHALRCARLDMRTTSVAV